MAQQWVSPVYRVKAKKGNEVVIDVTTSVSASLPPHKVLREKVIPSWKKEGLASVLDFGAGALRHTFPLLNKGFQVCSVEFQAAFQRSVCLEALTKARRNSHFSALVWPHDFISDNRRFDAALLCFVLQVMPLEEERNDVLNYIYKKLRNDGYLLYMARFGQINKRKMAQYEVEDGYFMWPKRKQHSFYTEFNTDATHAFFKKHRFRHIKSLSARGTEQVFVYAKGKGTWI